MFNKEEDGKSSGVCGGICVLLEIKLYRIRDEGRGRIILIRGEFEKILGRGGVEMS